MNVEGVTGVRTNYEGEESATVIFDDEKTHIEEIKMALVKGKLKVEGDPQLLKACKLRLPEDKDEKEE